MSYIDAYYAKDGYRTAQYRAKLSMDRKLSHPEEDYEFNSFSNRKHRRKIAKQKGIFKFGLWKKTLENLENKQTLIRKEV